MCRISLPEHAVGVPLDGLILLCVLKAFFSPGAIKGILLCRHEVSAKLLRRHRSASASPEGIENHVALVRA